MTISTHIRSALPFLSSCSSPGYCIANDGVEEVNRKLVSATELTDCLDSLLPLPAAFPITHSIQTWMMQRKWLWDPVPRESKYGKNRLSVPKKAL